MVIPHRHQHAAMGRGARHVGVAHGITRTVDPRPLAVPQAKNAVEFTLTAQFRLLATPDRGRGQILVQALLKGDVRATQQLFRAPHLQVDSPQRRSPVAGDIARRVQPCRLVPRLLRQHQTHKRLRAVQEHRRLFQIETIAQGNLMLAHGAPPNANIDAVACKYRSQLLT